MKRIRRMLAHRRLHVVAAMIAVVALSVVLMPKSAMRLDPDRTVMTEGESFTLRVMVASPVTANVFAGDIFFDAKVLSVESIDYNTSIADIWVEKPWYENGAGTINFGGGTTVRGGFSGEGTLIAVTFRTHGQGSGVISLRNARILLSDGLGTGAELEPVLDTVITVESANEPAGESEARIVVVPETPVFDLDRDGVVTYSDASRFVFGLASGDSRLDFDRDGRISVSDLRLLLAAIGT